MSPLNRGPLLGPRIPPAGIRPPPPPRFGGRLPPPGLPPRMPLPPMSPVFGPVRQRLPPPPCPGGINRPPNGPMPLFGPRVRPMAPIVPSMGPRGTGPRGPLMRPWHRRALMPQVFSHTRPRFSIGNGNVKGKAINNAKKVSKLEELELKKPWMTDEIRSEIQKKNKLYAKAKKNKDAKEWEEFKDLRNKVTRMIRDAKNDYLAKHPEQGGQKTDDKNTIESEGVQKTENATEQSEQTEEMQPSSEQAHLYPSNEEPYDPRDENYTSNSEEDESFYCEMCDKDFPSEDGLFIHKREHKLCGIDGCTFTAHPLLVEKHISMQHSSGLYHRIKNVSTPEDIEKWILERKKKYPTKANIELKKVEKLEKEQRGEIVQQRQDNTKRKRKKIVRSNRKKTIHVQPSKILSNTKQQNEVYRGVYEFSGTLKLRQKELEEEKQSNNENENDHDEGTNYISDEETLIAVPQSTVTSCGIPSLVANYESTSEDNEAPEEVPVKRTKLDNTIPSDPTNKQSIQVETINKIKNLNTTHLNLEAHKFSNHPPNENRDSIAKTSKNKENVLFNHNSKKKEQNSSKNKKQPYTSQLLEKLLSRAIQHERNLICQCIKYIVDNNFFD